VATGWAIFSFTVISVPLYFIFLERWVEIRLWHHLSQLSMSTISTTIMALLVYYFMEEAIGDEYTWSNLFATVIFGCITYLILSILLQHKKMIAILPFIKKNLSKK